MAARQTPVLTEDMASMLRSLHADILAQPKFSDAQQSTYRRYVGYIHMLRLAGWSYQSIAAAAGVSRQAVHQIIDYYEPTYAGLPPVAPPPSRPVPGRRKPWPYSPPLSDELINRLHDLRIASSGLRGQVRGTAREDSPEWQAGREFAAIVNHLITDGPYTLYGIARDLGVQVLTLDNRLARHGHRGFRPSQAPKSERAS